MCSLVVDINNVYLYVLEKDRDYCLYVDRNHYQCTAVAPKSVASYSFVLKGIRGSAFDFIVLKTICFGRSYSTTE